MTDVPSPADAAPASSTAPASTTPKLTLHWLDKSRAHRILWLLEELKVDYELKTYSRKSNMLAPQELKDVHPLGKSPVLEISRPNSSSTLVIPESALIVEYLLENFGQHLIPTKYTPGQENQIGGETESWLRYRYYMHYAEGSLMPFLTFTLVIGQLKSPSVPFLIRPISKAIAGRIEGAFLKPNLKTHFAFLENQLATSPGQGKFFAGPDLSGADIMLEYPLSAARGRAGVTQEKYPNLWAYVEMLHERDAYKRAIKKAESTSGKEFSMKL